MAPPSRECQGGLELSEAPGRELLESQALGSEEEVEGRLSRRPGRSFAADAFREPLSYAQLLVNPPEVVPAPPRWRGERPFLAVWTAVVVWMTGWVLWHILVPFVFQREWRYNLLLGVLGVFTFLLASYSLQIGIGSWLWTRRFHRVKDEDWHAKWQASTAEGKLEWDRIKHFVIITTYKEDIKFLLSVAYTLMHQGQLGRLSEANGSAEEGKTFCQKHIYLVLGMEISAGKEYGESKFNMMKEELSPYFADIMATFHPDPLAAYPRGDGPEIRGKASNYRWAAGRVDDYVRQHNINPEDCLVHVADYDSLFDPNHFPCVTYDYCTNSDRESLAWQPCMMPTCNFWQLTPFVRQITLTITAQEMMCARDGLEFQIPYSTYGYPLKTLRHIGAGHAGNAQDGDVITEDHHMFIKGFFATQGRLTVRPVYLPCFNYTEEGMECIAEKCKCLFNGCTNWDSRFTQASRHLTGLSEFAYFFSLLSRSGPRTRYGFRGWGYARLFALFVKLLKIHSVSYLGLWVFLGGVFTFVLNALTEYCHKWDHVSDGSWHPKGARPPMCKNDVDRVISSAAAWFFWSAAGVAFVGMVLCNISFTRMLRATQHRIEHIANPSGAFSPARQRLVEVGGSGPWIGVMIQLTIENILFSVLSNLTYGTLAAFTALKELIFKGHRMKYVANAQNR